MEPLPGTLVVWGRIDERVVQEYHQKAAHQRSNGNPNASFCILDGTDTARLLLAHKKL